MKLWLAVTLFLLGVLTKMFAENISLYGRHWYRQRKQKKDIDSQLRLWSLERVPGETVEESKVRIRDAIHGFDDVDRDTPVMPDPNHTVE